MSKKIIVAVLIVLSFVGGSLSPRPSGLGQGQECKAGTSRLKKDQGYKAGDYTIYYRIYKGRGGKIYHKIDINGKRDLKGGIYKKGATIEEKK
jgi:hypothetical protein